nr:MAG TPA: hypothetical protein [Caudoviricetes sp.]
MIFKPSGGTALNNHQPSPTGQQNKNGGKRNES